MFGEAPWAQPTPPTTTTQWSRDEDKLFEQALVMVPEGLPDRWRLIGEKLGKSATEVEEHYKALEHDVWEIESGRVDMPRYLDDMKWEGQISFESKKHGGGDADRKKGTPWSEHEHKLFLIGLTKFGKGDWRSISRNVVVTRTPTQVASHAQKYFLRQSSVKKERKRTSIHDITIVDGTLEPADQNNLIASPATPVQQAPTLGHMPDQRGQMGYQNFGFPPM